MNLHPGAIFLGGPVVIALEAELLLHDASRIAAMLKENSPQVLLSGHGLAARVWNAVLLVTAS